MHSPPPQPITPVHPSSPCCRGLVLYLIQFIFVCVFCSWHFSHRRFRLVFWVSASSALCIHRQSHRHKCNRRVLQNFYHKWKYNISWLCKYKKFSCHSKKETFRQTIKFSFLLDSTSWSPWWTSPICVSTIEEYISLTHSVHFNSFWDNHVLLSFLLGDEKKKRNNRPIFSDLAGFFFFFFFILPKFF